MHTRPETDSGFLLHIATGRWLDRLVLAAAWRLRCSHQRARMRGQPLRPIGPPTALVFGSVSHPLLGCRGQRGGLVLRDVRPRRGVLMTPAI